MKASYLVSLIFAVFAFFLLFASSLDRLHDPSSQMRDGRIYFKIAEGKVENIAKPFTKRILHPKLASLLSRTTSLSLKNSFFLISLSSLAVLFIALILMFKKTTSFSPALALPLFVVPYLSHIFVDYYMHDLFFSMVLSLFFLALVYRQFWLAIILLIPLFLAREATMLLCLVLLGVMLSGRKFKSLIAVGVVTVIGLMLSSYYGNMGLINRHGLGELFYMVSKVIFNSSGNFFGITLWADTFSFQCDPSFVFSVPEWLSLGSISQVGICSFNIWQPIITFNSWMTLFGLGPLVLFFLLWKKRKNLFKGNELWLNVCLIYGVIAFLIGPLLGPGGYRLMGYGWPAFWLAGPFLLRKYFVIDSKSALYLIVYHVLLSWVPYLIDRIHFGPRLDPGLIFAFAVILSILGYRLIKRLFLESQQASTASTA